MSIVAWFLYGPSKELVFVPVASALTGSNRDCLTVAYFGQEPEIQRLVSRSQIASTDLPSIMDGQTDNYHINILMVLAFIDMKEKRFANFQ